MSEVGALSEGSGRAGPGPVTPEDVEVVVGGLVAALIDRRDRDWHVPAGPLDWDCWETLEHLGDSLLFYTLQLVPVAPTIGGGYPFAYRELRPGGPEGITFAHPDEGPAGVLRIVTGCGGLLASLARTADPAAVARHMWGASDREGFAAMGVVEAVAHGHDVAGALDLDWDPPADACDRTLFRLFPHAPAHPDRVRTLLWATGRADLPDHPRQDEWRWYGEPR